MQIPFVDKAFRAYVKSLSDDVFYFVEWSLAPSKPAKEALETIRKEVKIDRECLSSC